MPILQEKISDITFIGSGISTSFTLIALLNKLSDTSTAPVSINITLIEKNDEFHTGLAYGKRSGESTLLITSLADFLPNGPERKEFISWLSLNKEKLIAELLANGGELSQNWVDTHHTDIFNNNWEHLYIPRKFFGDFVKDKLNATILNFNIKNHLELDYIVDEAIDIKKTENHYEITLAQTDFKIISKKIILSIGMAPFKQLWNESDVMANKTSACLIHNPYNPNINYTLNQINQFVNSRTKKSNVLILGANASAMEMIYKIHDISTIKSKVKTIFVISPQGELPNSAPDEIFDQIEFIPEHLNALKVKTDLKAIEIFNAANLDLDVAASLGYGTAITERPVSQAFISLLDNLNQHELKEFGCHYGHEIGKRQRRAGMHYTNVVATLKSEHRLLNISGYFNNIFKKDQETFFSYRQNKKTYNSEESVQVVINCIGSKQLNEPHISDLIDNLIGNTICKPNKSMRGFEVDENFQASKNFYIMGPLLAGNLINNMPLWHIEHCGRIITLGALLADHLLQSDI